MVLEREVPSSILVEVLDRVLDKGIVIDAWVRASLVATDITVEARALVTPAERKKPKPPGGVSSGSGPGETPARAGYADLLPRAPRSRHRRPID